MVPHVTPIPIEELILGAWPSNPILGVGPTNQKLPVGHWPGGQQVAAVAKLFSS